MEMVIKINGQPIKRAEKAAQTVREACKKKPELVLLSSGASIMPLIMEYVKFSEYLAIGVLMFAGTLWMFGHRTKAIEMLIGVVIGYEVILHAQDFIHWLKLLAN